MIRTRLYRAVVSVSLVALAIAWVLPIVWMLGTALKPQADIFEVPPRLWPKHMVLDNFIVLFRQWPIARWILNSLVVAFATTGMSVAVSSLAAYAFARLRWPGRDAIFICMLLFVFVPWQVNLVPLFFLVSKLRMLNTYMGVILPMVAMPIGVFLLRQFFLSIPREIEDAARVDGCSSLGIFLRIILPMSGPVLAAFALYIFNYSWTEFLWSLVCLQKRDMMTVTVGLKLLQGSYTRDYGLVMAGATFGALPSLVLFIVARRRLIRGFTLMGAGGKG